MKAGAELSRLTRAVGENEKAIANLTAALETAQGTAATGYITNRINELDEKNIRLKTRINELNRPEPTQLLPGEPIPLIKNIFGSFSSAFDTMTAEEKRTALRAFIDKIVWDGENINIYLFGSSAKTASVPQCENSK
jgi:site-specific DNA recombinase